MKRYPSQKLLREYFEYLPLGMLIWKRDLRLPSGPLKGKKAGKLKGGYFVVKMSKKYFPLHKLIWIYHNGTVRGKVIDHINRDKLDNRIENLRLISISLNNRNSKRRAVKGQTSQFKGVAKDKAGFCARIVYRKKLIYLGYFKNEIEAARAYDAATMRYYGTDTFLNFPKEYQNEKENSEEV